MDKKYFKEGMRCVVVDKGEKITGVLKYKISSDTWDLLCDYCDGKYNKCFNIHSDEINPDMNFYTLDKDKINSALDINSTSKFYVKIESFEECNIFEKFCKYNNFYGYKTEKHLKNIRYKFLTKQNNDTCYCMIWGDEQYYQHVNKYYTIYDLLIEKGIEMDKELKFTKDDLKTGMLVEFRDCSIGLVINETIITKDKYLSLNSLDEKLCSIITDIIRVSKVLTGLDLIPDDWSKELIIRNLLWERPLPIETIEINGTTYEKDSVVELLKSAKKIK